MASTYLTRTNGSAVTAERKQFTISFWVKRSATGVEHALCSAGNGGGSEEFSIRFESSDRLDIFHYTNSYQGRLITNRKFRDTNAWYHIYFLSDTANGTAGDRMQLYINGVRETSFATNQNASQNDLLPWNVDERHQIGSNSWNNSGNGADHLNGCMSHFYNVAGSIIDVSQFGSTDSTTGEWKINTSPTIASYGTAGFLVLKDGNTVTDQSPNSNNFTVGGGTLTKTEDCPSNVFATLNPLNSFYSGATFSNGNNRVSLTSGTYAAVSSTLGFNSGKWYAEFKAADATNWVQVGIVAQNPTASGQPLGYFSDSYGYIGGTAAGGVNSLMNNDSNTSYASTYGNGDIISVAVDCDNNKLYFGLNGTWLNSGNPESGATGTGAAFTISSSPTSGFYYFAVGNYSGSQTPDWEANFGNGYFGTTAVSSAGTNASGNGIFEYDVPTGYTALSTKGLNS